MAMIRRCGRWCVRKGPQLAIALYVSFVSIFYQVALLGELADANKLGSLGSSVYASYPWAGSLLYRFCYVFANLPWLLVQSAVTLRDYATFFFAFSNATYVAYLLWGPQRGGGVAQQHVVCCLQVCSKLANFVGLLMTCMLCPPELLKWTFLSYFCASRNRPTKFSIGLDAFIVELPATRQLWIGAIQAVAICALACYCDAHFDDIRPFTLSDGLAVVLTTFIAPAAFAMLRQRGSRSTIPSEGHLQLAGATAKASKGCHKELQELATVGDNSCGTDAAPGTEVLPLACDNPVKCEDLLYSTPPLTNAEETSTATQVLDISSLISRHRGTFPPSAYRSRLRQTICSVKVRDHAGKTFKEASQHVHQAMAVARQNLVQRHNVVVQAFVTIEGCIQLLVQVSTVQEEAGCSHGLHFELPGMDLDDTAEVAKKILAMLDASLAQGHAVAAPAVYPDPVALFSQSANSAMSLMIGTTDNACPARVRVVLSHPSGELLLDTEVDAEYVSQGVGKVHVDLSALPAQAAGAMWLLVMPTRAEAERRGALGSSPLASITLPVVGAAAVKDLRHHFNMMVRLDAMEKPAQGDVNSVMLRQSTYTESMLQLCSDVGAVLSNPLSCPSEVPGLLQYLLDNDMTALLEEVWDALKAAGAVTGPVPSLEDDGSAGAALNKGHAPVMAARPPSTRSLLAALRATLFGYSDVAEERRYLQFKAENGSRLVLFATWALALGVVGCGVGSFLTPGSEPMTLLHLTAGVAAAMPGAVLAAEQQLAGPPKANLAAAYMVVAAVLLTLGLRVLQQEPRLEPTRLLLLTCVLWPLAAPVALRLRLWPLVFLFLVPSLGAVVLYCRPPDTAYTHAALGAMLALPGMVMVSTCSDLQMRWRFQQGARCAAVREVGATSAKATLCGA